MSRAGYKSNISRQWSREAEQVRDYWSNNQKHIDICLGIEHQGDTYLLVRNRPYPHSSGDKVHTKFHSDSRLATWSSGWPDWYVPPETPLLTPDMTLEEIEFALDIVNGK